MPVIDKIASALGGNIVDGISKLITIWKVPAEVVMQNQTEIYKIQSEITAKTLDAVTAEINQGGSIITAEAGSQSWLPRNVRPLLLLLWGVTLTLNSVVPIVLHPWYPNVTLFQLDPWIYKLTAIGFTGYVTARTWEKVTDTDK